MKIHLLSIPALCLFFSAPAAAQCVTAQDELIKDITSSNLAHLGSAVDVDGDFLVAGAPREISDRGTASVFQRNAQNGWTQVAKITATGGVPGDNFGASVAISGTLIVVGAPRATVGGFTNAGRAYVFRKSGNNWVQEDSLSPSDAATNDYFGESVDIEGSQLIVGSWQDDNAGGTNAGSAYVYERTGIPPFPYNWVLEKKLVPGAPAGSFGRAVAIQGNYAVIGAPHSDDNGSASGAVHIWERRLAGWFEDDVLTGTSVAGDLLGWNVAFNGNHIIALSGASSSGAPYGGSATVFDRKFFMGLWFWSTAGTFTNPDAAFGGGLNQDVEVNGSLYFLSTTTSSGIGTIWGWQKSGSSFVATRKWRSSPSLFGDYLGCALASDGTELFAGAPLRDVGSVNEGGYVLKFDLNDAGSCTPSTYCTSKQTSIGCTPDISSLGVPSASLFAGFTVLGQDLRNNKSGLLFYTVGGSHPSIPFQGGTLCVGPSGVKRTPALSSGGAPAPTNDCSGVFSIDMNAFAKGQLGGNPDAGLLVVGTKVQCQWWGRDPGFPAPNNTMLSDALEYEVHP